MHRCGHRDLYIRVAVDPVNRFANSCGFEQGAYRLRTDRMRSGWRLAAAIGGLILLASACTGPGGNNNLASVSPASSPSSSPTQAPVVTSPSPSPAAEPTASTLAVAGLPVHNGEVGV